MLPYFKQIITVLSKKAYEISSTQILGYNVHGFLKSEYVKVGKRPGEMFFFFIPFCVNAMGHFFNTQSSPSFTTRNVTVKVTVITSFRIWMFYATIIRNSWPLTRLNTLCLCLDSCKNEHKQNAKWVHQKQVLVCVFINPGGRYMLE